MKPTSIAGGPGRPPGRLKVDIDSKAFRAADGTASEVLRGLDFELQPGTFTCLIGPSGCGKTTTLRLILGLDRDFTGTIELPSAEPRMAAVFQEPRLLPWRTVEQNVRLALPPGQDSPGISSDLARLFATLGLDKLRARYPEELSLGLARRVALARAFAVMPDILLLDEPFVSLDEHTADRLRALLIELWQAQGATVLMVTHNVREAARLADRLLLMNGHPAQIVGDVTVPLPRQARGGDELRGFLDTLTRNHPETVLA
ncbi:MAG: ATP-binding cassette domain-containing protein [Kiloniellaceae bacterium]